MIAIHNKSAGFHTRWESYCKKEKIPFKLVDCLSNDIVSQLKDCDALMWHHSHNHPSHIIISKQILFALEQAGKVVFPNFNTNWHFDDKLGQKYLLEAFNIPLVPTNIFYSKEDAINWLKTTTFPKVFKLRGGSASSNVILAQKQADAIKLVNKAFGRGFSNYDSIGNLREQLRKWLLSKISFFELQKSIFRLFYPPAYSRIAGKERGYVYFQDFISGNDHDFRVVVIADKAFAIKRLVRKNDFRASGSGSILYEKHHFNDVLIRLSFDINKKLNSQCTAMDFVYKNGIPLLIEISYGFVPDGYDSCPGYWDKELTWHEGKFDPYGWIVEEVINYTRIKNEKREEN